MKTETCFFTLLCVSMIFLEALTLIGERVCGFQTSTRRAMVVLAQYKEGTTWAMRLEDECDVEVRVYQSANHRDPYFVENLGGEAAKYFAKIKDSLRGLYFDSECCGQFSTSFPAIKRRPKSFYQRMRKWVTSKGDSIHSNKNQHKPTVEKGKGLEPLWSVIFDATPLHFDTKLTGSFASLVKVELEKQAKKVATEKAKAPRRRRSRRSTKVT